jgi:hypothetical protein
MAYFANGTEGMVFDEECCECRFGDKPCPIALVQAEFNYSACNVPIARKILDTLVKNNGECAMLRTFWDDLHLTEDEKSVEQTQLEI